MASMGAAALFVAFLVAIYGTAASFAGGLNGRKELIRSAEASAYVNFALVTAASVSLLYSFIIRDFSLKYVYEYCSRSLSNYYAVTAFWAGQEGSLLLWMWLLAACSALAIFMNRHRHRDMMPWVTHILMANSVFFLLLLNFVTDPFITFPGPPPPDGYGLNPLLQNPGMIYHPPTLFVGYVGLTIPYAFAMAALLSGRPDNRWILSTRRWTVISWLFLGVGILLGAEWAYVELGWGGYWAWDPVENASLMPWLTATAFMHSIMIQEKRGMMKIWNMSLIIVSYFLVLFGTFITRSGVISSVHAFGKSSLGTFFLVFMVLMLVLSLAVLIWRRKLLKPDRELSSVLSRESGFLLLNMTLAAMTFAVFWGTLFPALTELVKGTQIAVGPAFYNKVNVPMGLLLLLLMGVCPLLGWSKTDVGMGRIAAYPLFMALIAGVAARVLGVKSVASILVMAFSAFVLTSVATELFRGTRVRMNSAEEAPLKALFMLTWRNRRRYGGYLVHVGMVLIFIGLAGSTMVTESQATLRPKGSMTVGDYTLKYEKMEYVPTSNRLAVTTRLKVYKDGEALAYLIPERRFYEKREDNPTSEVSIMTTWKEDLYVILTGYNKDGRASFRALINPLVIWLWIGGVVATLGTILAVFPVSRRQAAKSTTKGAAL
jgi:cytochrome c-type biogenesis protein CcmF